MDTDLVVRAQRGHKEAYAILASGIADRFLAVMGLIASVSIEP